MVKLKLAIETGREMWFFDLKRAAIWPVWAIRESRSGDTIETSEGQIIRTSAKNHAVFNSYDYARLAQDMANKEQPI